MLCDVMWVDPGILKDCSALVFSTKQSKKSGPLDPDKEGTTILRNAGNYTPNDTLSPQYFNFQLHLCENIKSLLFVSSFPSL
jgi:hypothetical protein